MLAKHALSQLSYGPVLEDEMHCRARLRRALRRSGLRSSRACRAEAAEQRRLVGLGRLELPTSRLSSARSNQLSYKPQRSPCYRGIEARSRASDLRQTRRTAQPPARVRPRRKRNEDGEIPPMELNNASTVGP